MTKQSLQISLLQLDGHYDLVEIVKLLLDMSFYSFTQDVNAIGFLKTFLISLGKQSVSESEFVKLIQKCENVHIITEHLCLWSAYNDAYKKCSNVDKDLIKVFISTHIFEMTQIARLLLHSDTGQFEFGIEFPDQFDECPLESNLTFLFCIPEFIHR